MKTFRLAPMTTDIRIMTAVVLLLPVILAVIGVSAPGPSQLAILGGIGLAALVYLFVWFWWRPSRFELTAEGLKIVWPLRSRLIPTKQIRDVSLLSRKGFRGEYKYGLRVGAGGLWGGFGLLVTDKGALVMYVSRTDEFVRIRCEGARPLLITPEQPERFFEEIKAVVSPR